MKLNKLKLIVAAGTIAFVGIIATQVYLLRQAFDYEEKKINQNIQVSLLEVANEINDYYGYESPKVNPIEKISRDYYIVNMRNDFDAKVLELLLTNKFKAKGINTNFEYAIYDCETDAMIYGSFVNLNKLVTTKNNTTFFPKANNLVYYFAVRFPEKNSFIYSSLQVWMILCLVMLVTLFIYLYAMYIILQQQKFANLQKDFINNMTHEFKTPLSSILIASNFLSNNKIIAADEKLITYSRIITEQGKKLDTHLEKILNVAKNDGSPMLLNKEPVDMDEAIKTSIGIIQLKYPEAAILVNNELEKPIIQADAFHLANIIYNLLDNAIKYCDKNPVIKIDLKNKGGFIVMQIKDNGIGIEPKYLKHIFEKFYRAPQSRQITANGFGLGLYYVQKICQLHQWKIQAASTTGIGTDITLTIKQS